MSVTLDPLSAPDTDRLATYYGALRGAIDSYVEGYLLEGEHHALRRGGERIGTVAVHGGRTLVHLELEPGARRDGRAIFAALVRRLGIAVVLVPTSDEALLALALDDFESLRPQGTLFHDAGPEHTPEPAHEGFALRPLTEADAPRMLAMIDDDFLSPDEVARFLESGGLFVGEMVGETGGEADGALRSVGVIEAPRLLPARASIGMFVHPEHRRQGLAVDTLVALKRRCYAQGWEPAAGCAHGNVGSWRSLERAGMVAGTRLLRVTLGGEANGAR